MLFTWHVTRTTEKGNALCSGNQYRGKTSGAKSTDQKEWHPSTVNNEKQTHKTHPAPHKRSNMYKPTPGARATRNYESCCLEDIKRARTRARIRRMITFLRALSARCSSATLCNCAAMRDCCSFKASTLARRDSSESRQASREFRLVATERAVEVVVSMLREATLADQHTQWPGIVPTPAASGSVPTPAAAWTLQTATAAMICFYY